MGCANSGQSGVVHSDTPGSNGLMAKVGAKGEAIMGKAKDLVDTEIAQPISNLADEAVKRVQARNREVNPSHIKLTQAKLIRKSDIEVGEVVEDKIESLFSSTDEKKEEMMNGLEVMSENVKPDTPIDDLQAEVKDELDEIITNDESKTEETIEEEKEKEKKEEVEAVKTES